MDTSSAIATLLETVPDASAGLPEEIFLYISRTTPLVNVDLLIGDELGRVLLSWRSDPYSGQGWHIPGGIVRFKETFESRIEKVAELEIGAPVRYEQTPIAVQQTILKEHDIRGHFISFLYRCFVPSTFIPENTGLSPRDAGYLAWHEKCPENLIQGHNVYRRYINDLQAQPPALALHG